jgi:hypothetical protein
MPGIFEKKRQLEVEYPNSLFVYLDETYIYKNLITKEIIISDNEIPDLKIPIGKGIRFSIIDGFGKWVY